MLPNCQTIFQGQWSVGMKTLAAKYSTNEETELHLCSSPKTLTYPIFYVLYLHCNGLIYCFFCYLMFWNWLFLTMFTWIIFFISVSIFDMKVPHIATLSCTGRRKQLYQNLSGLFFRRTKLYSGSQHKINEDGIEFLSSHDTLRSRHTCRQQETANINRSVVPNDLLDNSVMYVSKDSNMFENDNAKDTTVFNKPDLDDIQDVSNENVYYFEKNIPFSKESYFIKKKQCPQQYPAFHLDVLAWQFFSTSWEWRAIRLHTVFACCISALYYFIFCMNYIINSYVSNKFSLSYINVLLSYGSFNKWYSVPLMFTVTFGLIIQCYVFVSWLYRPITNQPSFIQENRLKMRTSQLACYATEKEALTLNRYKSSNIYLLLPIKSPIVSFKKNFGCVNNNVTDDITHDVDHFPPPVWYFATYPDLKNIPETCHLPTFVLTVASNSMSKTLSFGEWKLIDSAQHCELLLHVETSDVIPNRQSTDYIINDINNLLAIKYLNETINPPIYTNFVYPFKCNPPFINNLQWSHISSSCVPVGCYRCYFDIPWDISHQQCTTFDTLTNDLNDHVSTALYQELSGISLLLQGCGPAVFVFLNGYYIGYSTDGYLPAEFNMTQYLNKKEHHVLNEHYLKRSNCLVLICPKFCASSYLEDQDQWWLSGCFREIELIHWPIKLQIPIQNIQMTLKDHSMNDIKVKNMWIDDYHSDTELLLNPTMTFTDEKGIIHLTILFGCQLSLSHPFVSLKDHIINLKEWNQLITSGVHSSPIHNILSQFHICINLYFHNVIKHVKHSLNNKRLAYPSFEFTSSMISPILYKELMTQNITKELIGTFIYPLSIWDSALETSNLFSQSFNISLNHPQIWSAEDPNLYTLSITLIETMESVEQGSTVEKIIQVEACQIGFRSIRIQQHQLLINQQPIMVKGINRHEHHPLLGKAIPFDTIFEDLTLIKQHNFNAIRTSHYPNHPSFYTLCDQLGLYVVNEANIETHGDIPLGWNHLLSFLTIRLTPRVCCRLSNDPDWRLPWLQRISRMVIRDRMHPCIIIWSLGNEAGRGQWPREGKQLIQLLEYHQLCKRPIQYEPGDSPEDHSDIYCPMYASLKQLQQYSDSTIEKGTPLNYYQKMASQWNLYWRRDSIKRPFILCEYQHAMGNSNGNLNDYWKMFETFPYLQGGFIWDWVDQGFLKSTKHSLFYWAYGGDFKDVPNDKNFVINGLVYPDRRIKPALIEAKYNQQPIQVLLDSVIFNNEGNNQYNPNCLNNHKMNMSQWIMITPSRIEETIINESLLFMTKDVLIHIHIKNKYFFITLDHVTFSFKLFDYAHSLNPIASGPLSVPFSMPPCTTTSIGLQIAKEFIQPQTTQLSLIIISELKHNTTWALAKHQISRDQLFIPIKTDQRKNNNFCQQVDTHILPFSHPHHWSLINSYHLFFKKDQDMHYIMSTNQWCMREFHDVDVPNMFQKYHDMINERFISNPINIVPLNECPINNISSIVETNDNISSIVDIPKHNVNGYVHICNDIRTCHIFLNCVTGNLESVYIADLSTIKEPRNEQKKYSWHYVEMINQPVEFCFFRSPTDNDKGGANINESVISSLSAIGILGAIVGGLTIACEREEGLYSYASRWESIGFNQIKSRLIQIHINGTDIFSINKPFHQSPFFCIDNTKEDIMIHITQLHGPLKNVQYSMSQRRHQCNQRDIIPLFKSTTIFRFNPYGVIYINPRISPFNLKQAKKFPSLPRIGLRLILPQSYRQIVYYGLGPHENYIDRNSSTIKATHISSVDAMYEPYIVPAEYGGRGHVEWFSVLENQEYKTTDSHLNCIQKKGLLFRVINTSLFHHKTPSEDLQDFIQFSLHPVSLEALTYALHQFDLGVNILSSLRGTFTHHYCDLNEPDIIEEQNLEGKIISFDKFIQQETAIELNIDIKHMGLGGECSWFPCVEKNAQIHSIDHTRNSIETWEVCLQISLIVRDPIIETT